VCGVWCVVCGVLEGSLLAKRSLLMQRFAPKTEVKIWRPATSAHPVTHPLEEEQEHGAAAAGSNLLSGVVEECGEWEARVRLVHQRDTVLCVPLEHLALGEHVPQLPPQHHSLSGAQ
jgi:hypothetical protein